MQSAPIQTDAIPAGGSTPAVAGSGDLGGASSVFAEIFAKFLQFNGGLEFAGLSAGELPLIPASELEGIGDLVPATQQFLADGLPLAAGDLDEGIEEGAGLLELETGSAGLAFEQFFANLQIVAAGPVDSEAGAVAGESASAGEPDFSVDLDLADIPFMFDGPKLTVLGNRSPEPVNVPASLDGASTPRTGLERQLGEWGAMGFGRAVEKPAERPTIPLSILPPETRVLRPAEFGSGAETPPLPLTLEVDVAGDRFAASSPADLNAAALARADRQEFVDRVTEALRQAYQQTPKRLTLELTPPDLGTVRIQVAQSHGELIARLEADNSTARAMLAEHLPALERQLSQSGIQIQRFEVQQAVESNQNNAQGEQMHRQQQDPGQQQQQQQRQQHPSSPNWRFEDAGADRTEGRPLTMADLLALAPGMDRLI